MENRMTTKHPLWRVLALLFSFALFAAACGDDDDSSSADPAPVDDGTDVDAVATCDTLNPSGDLASVDFTGTSVTVGSKDFVEQIVLGEILVKALEAYGADVTNSTNLGGTVVNRDALLANQIDTYWEYNGTGWTVHLAQDDPSFDPEKLTTDVCAKDLADNDIRWIGRSPFNDTYGFATATDFLDGDAPFSLQSMADYLAANEEASLCLESEFPNRPDGLVLFEDATGYTVPESQVQILETGVIYEETSNGNCDFGEVYTTDGRIPALELNLVQDPGVFILYNVSLTMPDSVYATAPESWDALVGAILGPLDEDTMAELNRRVSSGGESASDVAADFLSTNNIG
jgi:osmoprotectant transport system substrate-binding protein